MRIKNTLSTYSLCFFIVSAPYAPNYAQSFVSEFDRPERNWINNFDTAKQIPVTSTIEHALQQCPTTGYCELLIDELTLTHTIVINRSHTRFTGNANNRIRRAHSNDSYGFYFQITADTHQIVFSGLNIDGESIERSPDVFGIGAYAASISHVAVINNSIQGLYGRDNAHAIAFYGTGGADSDAIEHVIIANNHITDLRTGSSESVAINGNVRHWEIINNAISKVNNIAIDAIGGEGTAPVQTLADGRLAPGPYDAARLGFIENNRISELSTINNPAYGNKISWAAAIYIDGAHSVKVSGNTITNSPWALEVGAENCIQSSFVEMHDNRANNSVFGDILIGGYSEGGYLDNRAIECDPHSTSDADEGHGYVSNLDIRNNRLESTNTGSSAFIGNTVLQHRITRSTIEPPYTKLNHSK